MMGHPSWDFPPKIHNHQPTNINSNINILCPIWGSQSITSQKTSVLASILNHPHTKGSSTFMVNHGNYATCYNVKKTHTLTEPLHMYRNTHIGTECCIYEKSHESTQKTSFYLTTPWHYSLPVTMAYWACKRSATSLTAKSVPSITSSETCSNKIQGDVRFRQHGFNL
jgi:DNA-directed RNA polymerase subunit L